MVEWGVKGKPSLLGLVSGVVAGLVAVTPASGFAAPVPAIFLGLVAGIVCFIFVTSIKGALGYDDSLDVFGIHGVGGIIGALGTAILASPDFGGSGILDYVSKPGSAIVAPYDIMTQLVAQSKAVALTIVWSGTISAVLFLLLKFTIGLRPSTEEEREGLDVAEHGERAYNY